MANQDHHSAFLRERPQADSTGGRWKSKRPIVVIGIVVGLTILLPSLLGDKGLPAYFQLHKQRDRLQQQVEELKQHDAELKRRIESIENDPEVLEQFVRERYNMCRRGEEVYEIVPERKDGQQAP